MQTVTAIGLDIAKSVFQVHGIDAEGKVVLGEVEAPDEASAKAAAAIQFGLDEIQRGRIMVQELASSADDPARQISREACRRSSSGRGRAFPPVPGLRRLDRLS